LFRWPRTPCNAEKANERMNGSTTIEQQQVVSCKGTQLAVVFLAKYDAAEAR
jgi:hypothetical protein